MTARNVSHPKLKLKTLGKEIFLEQGWELPKGYVDPKLKNPLNYTRAEWERAQRTDQHPRSIKAALRESWAISDCRKAFEHALETRGFYLARGDRRGHVCVDLYGEVYSLSRKIGQKKAALEKRLGKPDELRSVDQTKELIKGRLSVQFQRYFEEIRSSYGHAQDRLNHKKYELRRAHREARVSQRQRQEMRWQEEEMRRAARVRHGFKGLWDRLTGRYQRTRRQNEAETRKCHRRDNAEKEKLVFAQLKERKRLQIKFDEARQQFDAERAKLFQGINKHKLNLERNQGLRDIYDDLKRDRKHTQTIKPDFEPD